MIPTTEGVSLVATNELTNMNTAHTPGPWRFAEGSQSRGEMSSVYSGEKFRIAYVVTESINAAQRATDIANGKIIAAAPELLNACRAALAIVSVAIAKAEGRP
jgi:hypothetical protein